MAEYSDADLDAIKRSKLAAMQKAQQERSGREQAISEAKAQIEAALKNILTADAWEQWNFAKKANQENAFIAASEILRIAQSGKLSGKITKEQIKTILAAVYRQTHREIKIKRK